MLLDRWTELREDEKILFAQSLLNPIFQEVIAKEIKNLDMEILDMTIPMDWSVEQLTNFTKAFHKRIVQKQQLYSLQTLCEKAQTYLGVI